MHIRECIRKLCRLSILKDLIHDETLCDLFVAKR